MALFSGEPGRGETCLCLMSHVTSALKKKTLFKILIWHFSKLKKCKHFFPSAFNAFPSSKMTRSKRVARYGVKHGAHIARSQRAVSLSISWHHESAGVALRLHISAFKPRIPRVTRTHRARLVAAHTPCPSCVHHTPRQVTLSSNDSCYITLSLFRAWFMFFRVSGLYDLYLVHAADRVAHHLWILLLHLRHFKQ